jgi:hypothetical protein
MTQPERAQAILLAHLLTEGSEEILALIDKDAADEAAVERVIGGVALAIGAALAHFDKTGDAMTRS